MKVVLITLITPYKENICGPSGLPYHLMIKRPEGIDIRVLSFNDNNLSAEQIKNVEHELNIQIQIINRPKWIDGVVRWHLLFVRLLLKFPLVYYYKLPKHVIKGVKEWNPDGIWGYCEGMNSILSDFKGIPKVLTPPDSVSLYYYRLLGCRWVFSNWKRYLRYAIMYRKYLKMEKLYAEDTIHHMVGEEDRRFLKNINPIIQATFLRHPHYEVNANASLNLNPDFNGNVKKFHQPKIKLLIAGRYDLYMKQEADLLVERLRLNANLNVNLNVNPNLDLNLNGKLLRDYYSITFLGKGWEKHVKELRDAGLDVDHITFAPDYIEEICKHDIQITPISIGTGTKGKVLDALANGLLVIGTPYAMENIAVESGLSCIEYHYVQDVIDVLMDIPKDIYKYEKIAQEGRKNVLKFHDRSLISEQLFSLFKNN